MTEDQIIRTLTLLVTDRVTNNKYTHNEIKW